MRLRHSILIILLMIIGSVMCAAQDSVSSKELKEIYDRAVSVSGANPDMAIELLNKCEKEYSKVNDTLMIVECLLSTSVIHRINLNFSKSYDYAWEAMRMAEMYNGNELLGRVYQNLGMLYFIFGQNEESGQFFNNSLLISKELYDGDVETSQRLISNYFNLVMLFNQTLNTKVAKAYLDSCFIISERTNQDTVAKSFLYTELANIHFINKDYAKAEKILITVKSVFEDISDNTNTLEYNNKGYLVIIYYRLGEVYAWQEEIENAVSFYNKGLKAIDKYQAHYGLKADLLYNLSELYNLENQHILAYENLLKSKRLNDSIFGTKSIKNSELFEVKNKNREVIEKKNFEIAQKNEQLLEKERWQSKVKIFAAIFISLLIVLALYIQNRAQRKRHKFKERNDKRNLAEKNKELTSYTLQFIEKEKVISDLIDYIKENISDNSNKLKVLKSTKKSQASYWDEFNNRFISVNQAFYTSLCDKYPSLTSTDLKHCALIKLNFSAKEMAQLLGISPSSVHMTHHRLRKKFSIDRDVNLSNFISSF